MALPHEFDKVVERVQRITTDAKSIRWTTPELRDYINEGQREYCEKTRILRSEGPLTTRENSEIYNLPTDCFIVVRVERSDGCILQKVSSNDLLNAYGSRYRTRFGNPTQYYQDLDGQKQLRFFPKVDENVLSNYKDFTGENGAVISSESVEGLVPLIVDGVEVFDEGSAAFIAAASDDAYDSELGAVVDSTILSEDGTDENSFTSEEGAITGVLSTEGKFHVFYIRYAREDKLEVDDLQALQYYTLHKCYEKDGPLQNLQLSSQYELKFQDRVNREIGRVSSAQHAELRTRGIYA
jgi:hypothetical protein